MCRSLLPVYVVAIIFLVACEQRSGEAVVLAKEHIAAALADQTPTSQDQAHSADKEESVRPIGDDEISVDGYVMKPGFRGTSRDPRALKDEQWLVKVRIVRDGRMFNIPVEQAQFEKLKEGDRIRVSYRVGKYTGTVWSSKIDPE